MPEKAEALQQEGVEAVVGDLEEPDTLGDAFEGVDVLFLLTPASALEPSMGSNAVTAAKKAKVKHIVRNSAIKAAHDAPNRNGRLHALVEESVKASGIPWTILRPHYYMQNLLSSAGSVASDGMLYMNMGDAAVGMIDGRDVGLFAAKVIEDPAAHAGKVYTPTGPESMTMAQAAETLGTRWASPSNTSPSRRTRRGRRCSASAFRAGSSGTSSTTAPPTPTAGATSRRRNSRRSRGVMPARSSSSRQTLRRLSAAPRCRPAAG